MEWLNNKNHMQPRKTCTTWKDKIRQKQTRNGKNDYQRLNVDMDRLHTNTGPIQKGLYMDKVVFRKKKEGKHYNQCLNLWNGLILEKMQSRKTCTMMRRDWGNKKWKKWQWMVTTTFIWNGWIANKNIQPSKIFTRMRSGKGKQEMENMTISASLLIWIG